MKSVSEALDAMLPAFVATSPEQRALADAHGRHLAEDIAGRYDLPPFDNSSMDGYAVRAEDTLGASERTPIVLVSSGESRTGALPPPLVARTAMRIFTGAVLPEGADAIVIQEDTTSEGGHVHVRRASSVGEWVRTVGSDLRRGARMLERGQRIGAGEIGLLAAQGISKVLVHRSPRVAILSTGDELRDIDDPNVPGSIVSSNAYALAAMLRDAGCEPIVLPNVRDDLDAIVAALRVGLTADVLLTIGGVSVGDYDFVKEAFERVGITADFWKVRIKPGKPLIFARAGTTPVVGLPGNPMSAMVTFEALVRPGLRAMAGDPKPHRLLHHVRLAFDYRHALGRLELARARVANENGQLVATPMKQQGSGSVTSWVDVDALLLLPEDRATFAAGETVGAILLRDDTGSAASPFG